MNKSLEIKAAKRISDYIKISKFSGRRENFSIWFSKFKAQCAVKGISEALFSNFDSKLPRTEAAVLDPSVAGELL